MGRRFRKQLEKRPSRRGAMGDCRGMTLVEMVVVLVILMIVSSVIVPSMTGYIDRAKQQKYVMEARLVKQSLELYLLEQYASGDMDMMDFFEEVSAWDLNDPDCPAADYMETACSEGAYIRNLTLEEGSAGIREMVYVVDGCQVTWDASGYSVIRLEDVRQAGK